MVGHEVNSGIRVAQAYWGSGYESLGIAMRKLQETIALVPGDTSDLEETITEMDKVEAAVIAIQERMSDCLRK